MANSYGTTSALSSNVNSLTNASYGSLGTIDFTSTPPHECFVEVSLQASGATSGNQQAVIFVISSLDGTNFSDTPTSALEMNARLLGVVKLPDTSAHRSVAMPISPLFGGALPPKVTIYVKNDCGVSLAASGQVGQFRFETFG